MAVKVYNKKRHHTNYDREYQILKDIKHPSIVSILGCAEDKNYFYMEMEFCASGDLSKCFWNNQNSNYLEKIIKTISTELLLGIRTLHFNGIIHCNLKPTNILIDEFGNVKICDFKKALKVSTMTIADIRKNKTAMTPCYTAPELFSDDGAYSFKTDLWALGCIMYEMAVGQVPFLDESVNRLINKIINEEVNFNKKQFTNYSDEFLEVIKKLLEKDPNLRPSWGEIEKLPFWELNLGDENNNTIASSNSSGTVLSTNSGSGTKNPRPHSVNIGIKNTSLHSNSNSLNIHAKTLSNNHTTISTKTWNNSAMNLKNNNNNIEVVSNSEDDDDYSNSQLKGVGNTDQEFNFQNKSNYSSSSNTLSNPESSNYSSSKTQVKGNNALEFSVLNVSKIMTRDKRVTKNSMNDMALSLAKPDDLPQIQAIMVHNSDRVVKPIIGNKVIEPKPAPTSYDSTKIPIKTLYKLDKIKELIINDQTDELEKFLLTLYQLMDQYASKNSFGLLLNILNYFETIILSKDIANNIINTSFVKMFISFLDINDDQIRVRTCSVIAYLIRYATNIEQSFDRYNLTEKLISFISDNNVILNRKAIATLGEYLFFVSTQAEGESEEEINLSPDNNDGGAKWVVTNESLTALLFALNHNDEIVKFYALKTIENIVTLTTISKIYFAQSDDYINKITDIYYNDMCENNDMKTSALSSISHLIRQEPGLLKYFFNKVLDFKDLLEKETNKNQQCLINIILFGIVGDIENIKYINSDELLPTLINLLETSNTVIKSKIILLLSLIFTEHILITKYGERIFAIMQKLRKEKQNFYYYVKIFESYMSNFCKNISKIFINLTMTNKFSLVEITMLTSLSIISPYHKISYSLFSPEFLECIVKIIRSSNNETILKDSFDILKSFSENIFSVEQNSDFLITKFFSGVLSITSTLDLEYKRFPLNVCANILTILLDDDKLYSSVIIEGGKTNLINSMIITILPIVSDLVKNPDTVTDSLSFLSLIIERNSAFISYYRSVGIIDYIFNLMLDQDFYSNLNLIKILIKLIESNDTGFSDIIEMNLIEKVNYMISKDNFEEISIYTEYVIEMLFDLMFKINEVKRKKYANNFDKNDYRQNFINKIEKVAVNFKLCIKLLGCDNNNIQEKSCISLIFMLQFFPDGFVESVGVSVKFTSEDVPDLLKGLDSSCVKIHKKIIKIFKWIIEYQNDAQTVLGPYVSYIQIYVEKIMDSSKEVDVIEVAR